MPSFCVNKTTGEHEVYNLDTNCNYLPTPSNRIALGVHPTCHGAVAEARYHYNSVDGCYYCANDCHTR